MDISSDMVFFFLLNITLIYVNTEYLFWQLITALDDHILLLIFEQIDSIDCLANIGKCCQRFRALIRRIINSRRGTRLTVSSSDWKQELDNLGPYIEYFECKANICGVQSDCRSASEVYRTIWAKIDMQMLRSLVINPYERHLASLEQFRNDVFEQLEELVFFKYEFERDGFLDFNFKKLMSSIEDTATRSRHYS